jgi:two-component system copper resistance phosphate regulon response regulator CusR
MGFNEDARPVLTLMKTESARILIVEDEKKTAKYLRNGLTEHGFAVDVQREGEGGIHAALTVSYDLLVLDIMLPKRDGWTIISTLRDAGKQLPVLVLTARDSVQDRVKGLELGADDYLVKPFAFSELLARVRSILRRTASNQPETLRIADLELDLVHNRATRARKQLDLTPKEFMLLSLLARRKGEPLSRDVIAQEVWDMSFDSGTNVVDVHVRRLRSKVDDPFGQKLIHTLRGVGYVLKEHP